ncbi:MAG: maltotransferase domain-containing protein [Acidimicrobiales bacterium]
MAHRNLDRITIDRIEPTTPSRRFPIKAVVGEGLVFSADIYADGRDVLVARLRWRPVRSTGTAVPGSGGDSATGALSSPTASATAGAGATDTDTDADGSTAVAGDGWRTSPMREVGDDRWEGELWVDEAGEHEVVLEAWRDRFATWRHDIEIKVGAGQDVTLELEEGALLLEARADKVDAPARFRVLDAVAALRRSECSVQVRLNAGLDDRVATLVSPVPDADVTAVPMPVPLSVDRPRAGFSAWYEMFPRSEGGLTKAAKRLPAIAEMGFDVVYLPPIHPIGTTARKGRNNTLVARPGDPGSPWAIGSPEGGHTAIHPELGSLADFRRFRSEAADLGLEVALDYALQCSPDHPWVRDHPEWFWRRPDGSIRFAENPPKKYQDIYPINFWPDDDAARVALWEACRDVMLHWVDNGVRIFRVDNPHTKPMAFWAWMVDEVRGPHPDVILLSEAFTRPKVMAKLAEVGFTQSYTYFTWRNSAWELRQYVEELAYGPTAHYLRPNFWTNTPDILAGPLRDGPPAAFRSRFVLAATLVPNYGMYSGYELYENEPQSEDNEEYLHSEKYEIRKRDWDRADSLAPFITRVNQVRGRHPVFQRLRNIRFHHSPNDQFLVYSKGRFGDPDTGDDVVLVVVNLDPLKAHESVLDLDLGAIGLPRWEKYLAHDELDGVSYTWDGPNPYIRLDPTAGQVAHILSLRRG